ncbi:hypothetical protein vB_PsyM_KIL3b_0046 [Pseudomonas phage vB_PsyM_KIL3b]|uniref:Uncharacterized protein n=6 Tax=Flaumdravirus TaxID=2560133 RepID=A0A142IDZ8_9CAUD|nr:hypothetical protein BH774_gp156 [Pseudomonas phage vB_PsyM_KIL1]YP_009616725.1 hypothetical protein FDI83_gp165 [Pseudomonas phage vB_PsyM_KIL4]AMR57453.1 hypothetical protein vB_PsyM_KIL2_0051 [Pseudomonas phage vB_PsyM_KIL2]AMR57613.1 hypothetical protein vB_PsyM_KIL3_0046 [Pseudomonas phage vB_PsyM_KIL3]AMR57941.1 hypothetical protein vB_PsyM_KIL5_0050 [Pseudomonas phage vB_PsyM_KIL5]AMR58111.1 hypothetical protein vB_PsyM_KIL3b_0046 [Pseudomonas phage vB_PsyM_KIL3b]AMR57293.1 hypothet
MADTLPDVTLNSGWNDLYQITGIAAGSALLLKNKSSAPILIVIAPIAPGPSFTGGWDISASDWAVASGVPSGSKVWAKGAGRILVQVDE